MTLTHTLTSEYIDCNGRTWPEGTPVRAVGRLQGLRLVRARDDQGVERTLAVRPDMLEPARPAFEDGEGCPATGHGGRHSESYHEGDLCIYCGWGDPQIAFSSPPCEAFSESLRPDRLEASPLMGGHRSADPGEARKGEPVSPPPAARILRGVPDWVTEAELDFEEGWDDIAPAPALLALVLLSLGAGGVVLAYLLGAG